MLSNPPGNGAAAPDPPIAVLRDQTIAGRSASLGTTIEALLVPAQVAARLCGVSEATWWRLHAAAKVPAPVRLGGRTLWRRAELAAFCEAGCPDRRSWEAPRQKGGRS